MGKSSSVMSSRRRYWPSGSGGGLTREIRRMTRLNEIRAFSSRSRVQPKPTTVVDEVDNDKPLRNKADGLLKTLNVDLHLQKNRETHRTEEYEPPNLILRRGDPFNITVEFDRPVAEAKDDITIIMSTGSTPKVTKGTLIYLDTVSKLENSKWGAKKVKVDGSRIDYQIMVPCDAPVSSWTLVVQTTFEKKGDKFNSFRFKVKDDIFILFNAWCEVDLCYMPKEEERNEYVMNTSGRIWRGSYDMFGPMAWNYGQFDDVCLLGAMTLLDKAGLDEAARGDPILVSRALSKMANSNDNDQGVLTGNWSGNYAGGTSPTTWQGSPLIMEEYMRTGGDVRYAQCWVFSGLLTTLGRTLGMPTRSVTNFASAHDSDGSMTIDTHYSDDGEPLRLLNDSTWNFHVWNEAYFTRSDLPGTGYDGWQAFDSTPQELSEGMMQCGPAPVKAIKEGDVFLPYDGKFVFAEVNGEAVTWRVAWDGSMKPIGIDKTSIGKLMSTKAVGSDERHDVTNQYKYAEGSPEERKVLEKALKLGSRKKNVADLLEGVPDDCKLTLEAKSTSTADVTATLKVQNTSDEKRTVQVNMSAVATYYTGLSGDAVKSDKAELKISPKGNEEFVLKVPASEWINTIDADAILKIYCSAKVKETDQMSHREKVVNLVKPDVEVEVSNKTPKVMEEFKVTVRFTNPLKMDVTDGLFSIEGPGIKRNLDIAVSQIGPGKTVVKSETLTAKVAGRREVVVGFNSRQLTGISGFAEINVKK